MNTDWRLVQFIRESREQYGNIGREKIKIFLDEYVNEIDIESISCRIITKVIKRRNLFFDQPIKSKRKNKFSRYRTKKSPKSLIPGFVEVDSVIMYINNERHNFVCCIDICTKLAHVKKVLTVSSKQVKLTFIEFKKLLSYKIHTVQTDNGSEFFKSFHQYLEENNIKHQFIYPKLPKINGVVDIFNITIQEEFINYEIDTVTYDIKRFDEKLEVWMKYYNKITPHQSLGYMTLEKYLVQLQKVNA